MDNRRSYKQYSERGSADPIPSSSKYRYKKMRKEEVNDSNLYTIRIIFNSVLNLYYSMYITYSSLSNYPFNNNIAILESKIINFFLKSNFRGSTTLTLIREPMKNLLSCLQTIRTVISKSTVNHLLVLRRKEYCRITCPSKKHARVFRMI